MNFGSKYCKQVLSKEKLILVCDVDETLLTTAMMEVEVPNPNFKDIKYVKLRDNTCFVGYFTKIRPNLNKFLTNMSEKFDLHIMTMGTKPYVNSMLKLIDPKRRFFGNRVTTAEDIRCGQNKLDKAKEVYANCDNMVCVIDDRVDVWDNNDRVINVKPYCVLDNLRYLVTETKYKRRKDIITKVLNSIEDTDDYLENLEKLLNQIHQIYFASIDEKLKENDYQDVCLENLPKMGTIIHNLNVT
jgi:RNA polymerase II subunit A-like phosphatase